MIITLLNTEKPMLKKVYGFDEAFNNFHDIENKHNKPRTSNKTSKNVVLQPFKIIENKLIDIS